MTEPLKLFIKEIQNNDELKAKLEALEKRAQEKQPEEARKALIKPLVALAKEHGYELRESDFEVSTGQLSDDELGAVAAGAAQGGCGCVWVGGGGGTVDGGIFVCACAGWGTSEDDSRSGGDCFCLVLGGGQ